MTARFPVGQQMSAVHTASDWLRRAGTSYLPKTVGVRTNELDYVLQGLSAVMVSLEWLSANRTAFEEWMAAKKQTAVPNEHGEAA